MTDPRYELLKSGKACVGNRKTDLDLIQWAKKNNLYIYIGRKNNFYRESQSDWHNPFRGPDAIEQYKTYLEGKPKLMARISELKGKLLTCWCYPEPCHGDVLVELLKADA